MVATSDTVVYAVLAVTMSLAIVLVLGLLALALKGRTGLPKGWRRHEPPPLPGPVLGKSRRQVSIADVPSFRLLRGDDPPSANIAGSAPSHDNDGPAPEQTQEIGVRERQDVKREDPGGRTPGIDP